MRGVVLRAGSSVAEESGERRGNAQERRLVTLQRLDVNLESRDWVAWTFVLEEGQDVAEDGPCGGEDGVNLAARVDKDGSEKTLDQVTQDYRIVERQQA